nr:hypothetical protein [uncultured Holophaga sp.]
MVKRHTLLMVAVFAIAAILIGWANHAFQKRFHLSGAVQRVSVDGLSLELPDTFGTPAAVQFPGWEKAHLSKGNIGSLMVARKPADAVAPADLYRDWFAMAAYAPAPAPYEGRDAKWFFREFPAPGTGAFAIQKTAGQPIRMIVTFAEGGERYWIQFETPQPTPGVRDAFLAMVRSLRLVDGSVLSPAALQALASAGHEPGWGFIQPAYLSWLLPLGVLLALLVIQFIVRTFGGRLPQQQKALFQGNNLEISVRGGGKLQMLNACLVVNKELVTIYTYGSPFLVMSRPALKGHIEDAGAWLGVPSLILDLQGPQDFRKGLWKMRGKKGAKVRIFTQDLEGLRTALQN